MWTKEFPKKAGAYWFYGWLFGDKSHEAFIKGGTPYIDKPELCFVEVRKTGDGGFAYITHGHFMYKAEGATGIWAEAILPKIPKGLLKTIDKKEDK